MKQLKMLNKALKENYIVPAFNFANFDILNALLKAQKLTNSPIILQASESAINYIGEDLLKGIISSIKKSKLPISIHLDHGKTFNLIKKAINLGFDSVMIDGSSLPYDENVSLTKKVVKYAHLRHVMVEGELGVLAVQDDDATTSDDIKFTNPKQAKDFVLKTKVDSLAVSIGTNHGVNKYNGEPKIRYDILRKIEKEIPKTPIVLHGASLIEQEDINLINQNGGDIKKAVGNKNLLKSAYKTNICKINMDTDFRISYTCGVRQYLNENPSKYCPRDYGKFAIDRVVKTAVERIVKICKSQNKV